MQGESELQAASRGKWKKLACLYNRSKVKVSVTHGRATFLCSVSKCRPASNSLVWVSVSE